MMQSHLFRQRPELTSEELLRILSSLSPTSDLAAGAGEGEQPPTMEPSFSDGTTSKTGTGTSEGSKGFGWFSLAIILLVLAFVLWRLWVRFQRRQEQRLMDYRSAQADKVLGDMQMVPQHDDFDNELL